MALAVVVLLENEALTEGPVLVHQRHADGGIGIEHLLGGDDFELVRIDVEPEFFERDRLDGVIGPRQRLEVPVGTVKKKL